MTEKFIGYLKILEIADDVYMGAILVTNEFSVPVEFRVTVPVKPTTIQKAIYGEAMVPYIGTELCGTQLLDKITHDLEAVLVSPRYMLNLRAKSSAPILHVFDGSTPYEPVVLENEADTPDGSANEYSFGQLHIAISPQFREDYTIVSPLLQQLSDTFDLLEPFDRIDLAVEVLGKEDPRFSGR